MSSEDADLVVDTSDLYRTWNVFVCSFCADRDRNEHWHQYARRAGYALGFDPHVLRSLAEPQNFILAPVFYGAEKALNVAAGVVEDQANIWQTFKSPLSKDDVRKLSRTICHLILSFAPYFKAEAFQGERKWRLVKVTGLHGDDNKLFRSSKIFGLLGYHEFKFRIDHRGKVRLTGSPPPKLIPRIVTGPGNETEEWLRSVNPAGLLKSYGFDTSVSQSTSSLRFFE